MHVLEQYCPDKDIVNLILDLSDSWRDIYNICVREYRYIMLNSICMKCFINKRIFHPSCRPCYTIYKKYIEISFDMSKDSCSCRHAFIKKLLTLYNEPDHYRIRPIIDKLKNVDCSYF